MAKSKHDAQRETKGKVTFVMFQVEGDDETLQQGFRAMEQAFQRLGPPARSHAPLPGAVPSSGWCYFKATSGSSLKVKRIMFGG